MRRLLGSGWLVMAGVVVVVVARRDGVWCPAMVGVRVVFLLLGRALVLVLVLRGWGVVRLGMRCPRPLRGR